MAKVDNPDTILDQIKKENEKEEAEGVYLYKATRSALKQIYPHWLLKEIIGKKVWVPKFREFDKMIKQYKFRNWKNDKRTLVNVYSKDKRNFEKMYSEVNKNVINKIGKII